MGVDSTLGQVLRLTLRVPGPWAPRKRTVVLQAGLALVHGSWLFAPGFGLEQAAALVC